MFSFARGFEIFGSFLKISREGFQGLKNNCFWPVFTQCRSSLTKSFRSATLFGQQDRVNYLRGGRLVSFKQTVEGPASLSIDAKCYAQLCIPYLCVSHQNTHSWPKMSQLSDLDGNIETHFQSKREACPQNPDDPYPQLQARPLACAHRLWMSRKIQTGEVPRLAAA